MNRLITLLISFIVSSFSLCAETTQVSTYGEDTAHISRLIKNCGNLLFINPDSALLYSDTILTISKRINYKKGVYKAYNIKGIYNWMINDLDKATEMYRQALIYSDTINDPRSRAVIYGNIGLVFSTALNTDSTIYYFNKTIEYSKRHEINDMLTKTLFDLGNFYINKNNYVEAIKNLLEVKHISEQNNDSVLILYFHMSMGYFYHMVKQFDLSLQYYFKAIELNKNMSKVNIAADTYLNIGELYFSSKNDLDSAIYYYKLAIASSLPYEKANIEMAANIIWEIFF